jgi:hypothetical protein
VGVLLHAHFRLMGPNGQKFVIPAPVDKATPNAPRWWDHLAGQGLPASGSASALNVTYTAPQELAA